MEEFKLAYTSNQHNYDHETIYEKCKNHVISLLLLKSSTNHKGKDCKSKIMGGLSPIKIKNYEGNF